MNPVCRMWVRSATALLLSTLPIASNVIAAEPATAVEVIPAGVEAPSVFDIYARNREQGIANYVTVDLPLLTYSLLRQKSVIESEERVLVPVFKQFFNAVEEGLNAIEVNQSNSAEQEKQQAVLEANQQYIALLQSLLSGEPGAHLSEITLAEYQQVMNAKGIAASQMWGRDIDYSQYQPRGRYANDEQAERYFRTVRYAGAQFFAVQPTAATGIDQAESDRQVAQSLQLVKLIQNDDNIKQLREKVNDALTWQFGVTEDLDDTDIAAVISNTNNTAPSSAQLLSYAQEHHRQPSVIDAIVDISALEQGVTLNDSLTGWRLLPSRMNVRVAAQQSLIYPEVGAYLGTATTEPPFGYGIVGGVAVKAFPNALEWPALLGSEWAQTQLTASGETAFEQIDTAYTHARGLLDQLQGAERVQAAILHSGFNDFHGADEASRMHSLLAFQTWQEYVDILYVKQTYTPTAKGLLIPKQREGATLERAYTLYLNLGFAAREQFKHTKMAAWEEFANMMDQLAALSLANEIQVKSSVSDQQFLNNIDLKLLQLSGVKDSPIVVDIHTDANAKQVVYHATGYAQSVLQNQTRGARLSFQQFKHSMDERLTVAQWQAMLAEEKKP